MSENQENNDILADKKIKGISSEFISELNNKKTYQEQEVEIESIKKDLSKQYNVSIEDTEELINLIQERAQVQVKEAFKIEIISRKVPNELLFKLLTLIEKKTSIECETMLNVVLPK